jgi:hypothetical protein
MKWERAVYHLESLAQACAETVSQPIFSLRVTQLWAIGDLLGARRDLQAITVALAVNRPPAEIAWLSKPPAADHWANAVRLPKNPIIALWRSDQAPIWNHHIVRPALVWDAAEGERAEVLTAIRAGEGERVRGAGPTEAELAVRLTDELTVSRNALRAATEAYEKRRWAPGKLGPVADTLWLASHGYLDVLRATEPPAADPPM